jgi:hypothetical protein
MSYSRSTDISQLPSLGQIDPSLAEMGSPDGEDAEINNILGEIHDESAIQQGHMKPQIPQEAMGQYPPSMSQYSGQMPPMPGNPSLEQYQNKMFEHTQPLSSNASIQSQYDELRSQLQGGSTFTRILREFSQNLKLMVIIILSSVLLQNSRIQHFLTTKLIKIDFPYINTIIIAVTHMLLIIIGKNMV